MEVTLSRVGRAYQFRSKEPPQMSGGRTNPWVRHSLTRAISSVASLSTTSNEVRDHEQREMRDVRNGDNGE